MTVAVTNWVVALGCYVVAILIVAAVVCHLIRRRVAAENRRIDNERMRRHLNRSSWTPDGHQLANRILAELDRDDLSDPLRRRDQDLARHLAELDRDDGAP